jgi:hypothetical protein
MGEAIRQVIVDKVTSFDAVLIGEILLNVTKSYKS